MSHIIKYTQYRKYAKRKIPCIVYYEDNNDIRSIEVLRIMEEMRHTYPLVLCFQVNWIERGIPGIKNIFKNHLDVVCFQNGTQIYSTSIFDTYNLHNLFKTVYNDCVINFLPYYRRLLFDHKLIDNFHNFKTFEILHPSYQIITDKNESKFRKYHSKSIRKANNNSYKKLEHNGKYSWVSGRNYFDKVSERKSAFVPYVSNKSKTFTDQNSSDNNYHMNFQTTFDEPYLDDSYKSKYENKLTSINCGKLNISENSNYVNYHNKNFHYDYFPINNNNLNCLPPNIYEATPSNILHYVNSKKSLINYNLELNDNTNNSSLLDINNLKSHLEYTQYSDNYKNLLNVNQNQNRKCDPPVSKFKISTHINNNKLNKKSNDDTYPIINNLNNNYEINNICIKFQSSLQSLNFLKNSEYLTYSDVVDYSKKCSGSLNKTEFIKKHKVFISHKKQILQKYFNQKDQEFKKDINSQIKKFRNKNNKNKNVDIKKSKHIVTSKKSKNDMLNYRLFILSKYKFRNKNK